MNMDNNRLVTTFADLRSAGKKALLPFVTAGYPDLQATLELLKEFERRGVRICELGIPFSDPIADGPVIQASFTQSLAAGVTSAKIFEIVAEYRRRGGKMAMLPMVSYSIVYKAGMEAYIARARQAGFDGIIIPDLPLDEAAAVEAAASEVGLANVMLIAPTTPAERRLEIASHSRGFIYYMSVSGITGERTKLPPATVEAVGELRQHTQTPVCVGFGVSNAATVAEVCKTADGAIVGSAIVRQITAAIEKNLDRSAMVAKVGGFVSELLEPLN